MFHWFMCFHAVGLVECVCTCIILCSYYGACYNSGNNITTSLRAAINGTWGNGAMGKEQRK
jgi:hypothetical protein